MIFGAFRRTVTADLIVWLILLSAVVILSVLGLAEEADKRAPEYLLGAIALVLAVLVYRWRYRQY